MKRTHDTDLLPENVMKAAVTAALALPSEGLREWMEAREDFIKAPCAYYARRMDRAWTGAAWKSQDEFLTQLHQLHEALGAWSPRVWDRQWAREARAR